VGDDGEPASPSPAASSPASSATVNDKERKGAAKDFAFLEATTVASFPEGDGEAKALVFLEGSDDDEDKDEEPEEEAEAKAPAFFDDAEPFLALDLGLAKAEFGD
jgi:hypothetical protein